MATSPTQHDPAPEDLHPTRFAMLLEQLPEAAPITEEFDSSHGQKKGRWWRSQQEHMIAWFWQQSTKGLGAYSRKTPNRSAKTAYNRLLSPGGLLWINEALGRPAELVQKAADAAKAQKDYRTRCATIRQILPWEDVMTVVNSGSATKRRNRPNSARGLALAARQHRRPHGN